MTLAKLEEVVDSILSRVDSVKGKGEEATKQAMVLPLLSALGYDIWNPNEVCPEYEADTAVKKSGQKEKVDYAIILDAKPRIFVEVKSIEESLEGHQGQLRRYFMAAPTVSLGILTNGLEYRFFTDSGEPNIPDDEPFHIAKFNEIERGLEVMSRFQRAVFSPDSIREFATELIYTAKISKFLAQEIDIQGSDPSDNLVEWILRSPGVHTGRVTSHVIERFRAVTKVALQRALSKVVRRIITEIDTGVATETKNEEQEEPEILAKDLEVVSSSASKIHTTDEELTCFAILKEMFESSEYCKRKIYDPTKTKEVPIEIGYKDTISYFNIYFNKSSWWNMRIALDGKTKWIDFDLEYAVGKPLLPPDFELLSKDGSSEFRVTIIGPLDLLKLRDLIYNSFEKTIQDREKLRKKESLDNV